MPTAAPPSLATRSNINLFFVLAAVMVAAGFFSTSLTGYFCVAIPVIFQIALWFRAGAPGIPVAGAVFATLFVYYAVPMIRGDRDADYSPQDLADAGISVGEFLVAATVASWPFLGTRRRRNLLEETGGIADRHLVAAVYIGLLGGIAYYVGFLSGILDIWLGPAIGIVRSILLTAATVGCYLMGHAYGRRVLALEHQVLMGCCFLVLVGCSLANLLLNAGMMLGAAAAVGYTLTAKRLPWASLAVSVALVMVLHAGKFEVRDRYWSSETSSLASSSLTQIPEMMVDWFATGVVALVSGGGQTDFLQRASLLHILVLAQRATPDYVPYLEGETYAALPSMLTPRFMDPDKTPSQAGLNLLSIRYGLQTEDSIVRTTIGWGLVAEAYANFGDAAVIVAGIVFGLLCGALTRLSAGASATSWRMIVAIPATLALLDVEADFSYLIITLVQILVAALVVASGAWLAVFVQRPRLVDQPPRGPMVENLPAE